MSMLFILQGPVLNGPHPAALSAGRDRRSPALSWYLRRSIGVTLFTLLGLLLIVNQGYWKETTETLALVLAASVVSHGGRRSARHRGRPPRLGLCRHAADPRPDADHPDLRLPDPGADPVRSRHGAGPDRNRDLRHPRADPPHPPRHHLDAAIAGGGGPVLRRHADAGAAQGRTALRHAADHGRPDADHHAVAVDGGDRRPRRRGRSRRVPSSARSTPSTSPRASNPASASSSWRSFSTACSVLPTKETAHDRRCHFQECRHHLRQQAGSRHRHGRPGQDPRRDRRGNRPGARRRRCLADRSRKAKSWS